MASPKPKLKKLQVVYGNREVLRLSEAESRIQKMMNLVSEGTDSVEEFSLVTGVAPPGTFDKFVEKNKFSLRSVGINLLGWSHFEKNGVAKCLLPFFKLPNLEDIQVGIKYKLPRMTVTRLSHRGVMSMVPVRL